MVTCGMKPTTLSVAGGILFSAIGLTCLFLFGYVLSSNGRNSPVMPIRTAPSTLVQTEPNAKLDTPPETGFDTNNFVSGLAHYEHALASEPTNITLLLGKAALIAQQGSLNFDEERAARETIDIAQQVLALDPKNSDAWRLIGYAHEITQDYSAAHGAYAKSLELNPDNALTISQQAHAYDLEGRVAKADAGYRAALALAPDLDQALALRARSLVRSGRVTEALTTFERIAQHAKNVRIRAEALYSMGALLSAEGNHADAEQRFNSAIAADATFPLAYVGLASQEFLRANSQAITKTERAALVRSSFTHLQRALQLNPLQSVAAYQLGFQSMLLGNRDAARHIFKSARIAAKRDVTLSAPEKTTVLKEIDSALEILERIDAHTSDASIPSAQALLAGSLCYDDGCINYDGWLTQQWVDGMSSRLAEYSAQSLIETLASWFDITMQETHGQNANITRDDSGLITEVACFNGTVSATYNPRQCSPLYGQQCTSAPNTCGMRSAGTTRCGGTCSASPPDTTQCPTCTAHFSCDKIADGRYQISYTTPSCTTTVASICRLDQVCGTSGSQCLTLPIEFDTFLTGDDQEQATDQSTPSLTAGVVMSGHLTAMPKLVQNGHRTRLFWNTRNAKACTIADQNGVVLSMAVFSGTSGLITPPLSHQTDYSMTCAARDGATPPQVTETQTVRIVPTFQEI